MEEKEKKNEAESETPKEETKSRREFLKSAAIQGAVAALFGAVTFDSVMAKAMGRISEVQSIQEFGKETANDLHQQGFLSPDYFCQSVTCEAKSNQITCDGFKCGGAGQHFDCYINTFYCQQAFTCASFGCGPNYACQNTVGCVSGYVCNSGFTC